MIQKKVSSHARVHAMRLVKIFKVLNDVIIYMQNYHFLTRT